MLPDRRRGRVVVDSRAAEPPRRPPRGRAGPRAKRPPPFGFLKGVGLGLVLVVPTVAATVWVLGQLGLGNPTSSMGDALRLAGLFAGPAALVTAGGIGRRAALASAGPGGRRAAALHAAAAQAVAGAGLTLIAAIPHGELPASLAAWSWFGVAGAVTGAIDGALIGLVCGAPRLEAPLPGPLRRVPVVAAWVEAAASDPRLARAPSRSEGPTPLPTPVPLGGGDEDEPGHPTPPPAAREPGPP
jgi:hypothetical protein